MITFRVTLERFLQEDLLRTRENRVENIEWFNDTECMFHAYILSTMKIFYYTIESNSIPEMLRILLKKEGMVLGVVEDDINVNLKQDNNPLRLNRLQVNDNDARR